MRLVLLAPLALYAQQWSCVAKVQDIEKRSEFYTEARERWMDGAQRQRDKVEYRDERNAVFAVKTIAYPAKGYVPDFSLEQRHVGYAISAQKQGAGLKIKLSFEGQTTLKTIALPDNAVMEASIDVWIADNMAAFQKGQSKPLALVVPERFDWYRFEAVPQGQVRPGVLRIALQPRSLVLRWLSEPLLVDYDIASKRLVRYQGLSDIKNREGKNRMAVVEYRCPNPS